MVTTHVVRICLTSIGSSPVTQDTSATCPVTNETASVAAGCPVAPGGYDAPPVPLGPESLTWKYFGDWRGMLQGPWAGSMQNMHPQLGAAVEQHSIFSPNACRGCFGRCIRSVG